MCSNTWSIENNQTKIACVTNSKMSRQWKKYVTRLLNTRVGFRQMDSFK